MTYVANLQPAHLFAGAAKASCATDALFQLLDNNDIGGIYLTSRISMDNVTGVLGCCTLSKTS